VLVSGALWLGSIGWAGATPVMPNMGGEPSLVIQAGILDTLYGLGNLTRMDDSLDLLWGNTGIAHVLVVAKYSGYDQTFGYLAGESGGDFVPLVTVSGNGYVSGGEITFSIDQSTADFRWGNDPYGLGGTPGLWSALADENADGRDHMVTWMITGNAGHPNNILGAFVVGFEDLPGLGDADYNDLVVLVWGVTDGPITGPLAVPLPASLMLIAASVLGGAGWSRFRRR
jgi:uncharacterized protein DUF4114